MNTKTKLRLIMVMLDADGADRESKYAIQLLREVLSELEGEPDDSDSDSDSESEHNKRNK